MTELKRLPLNWTPPTARTGWVEFRRRSLLRALLRGSLRVKITIDRPTDGSTRYSFAWTPADLGVATAGTGDPDAPPPTGGL